MAVEQLIAPAPPRRLDAPPARARGRLPFSPWHLLLAPVAAVMLLPLVWMVVVSLQTTPESQSYPPVVFPSGVHFGNYPTTWSAAPFTDWFINSVIYSAATVAGNLVFCSLAAYAFARLRFFGRRVAFVLVLATLMIPYQVVIIPWFLTVKQLGLVDSVGGLIVPNLVNAFGVFLLVQFFRTLPIELEEAARIDGSSRLGVLFKIVLPLSLPALATLGIIQLLWSWNDFLWPLIIISTPAHMPLQLGLYTLQGAHNTQWNLVMAGTVMSQLPMLAAFVFAQRWFVQSLAYTGIKG